MAFDRVQEDPDICNSCFRKTHTRYERNYAVDWIWDPSEREYEFWPREIDRDPDVRPQPSEVTDVPLEQSGGGLKAICQCGFQWVPEHELDEGEDWKFRPLPKPIFFEYANRLEQRLQEKGVTFDDEAFWEELDELKSDPDEQFADDRIFEKAIQYAQARANGAMPGVSTQREDSSSTDSERKGGRRAQYYWEPSKDGIEG